MAHVHNDDCYDRGTLVCTLPEREAHTHDDTCYAESRLLSCGLEENPGHQHTEACFDENGELICQIPEGEGAHVHTDDCYTIERALICIQPELPVHVHDAGCFRTEEISVDEPEETIAPEQAVSTVPEMPVSDPNADLETMDDWNREFENFELSGNWANDLILVAATQQGRGESPNNFEAVLNDAGDAWVRHGYTRYGAWYGYPYAEWDAMFVSFCLRYAGIPAENVPNNPTAAFMAESFSMGELFAGPDYVPAVGDLIFFDTVVDDEITNIDHMGIVYHVDTENGTINTVEGDRTDVVATFGYYLNDEQIVGYGILPQNPNYIPVEGENTDITDEAFDGFIFMTTDEEEEPEETPTAEEAPAPAVPMPAQSWERTAGGIKVSVEAPEGAFPENTKIAVTPVNGSSLKDTVSDAVSGEVLEVQAVDITFFDAEGREIEPAVPIRVVMTPAASRNADNNTQVVHVDLEQKTAEVVDQVINAQPENKTDVVFDAEAFTIYAIVYTVDTYFRSYTGETYRVTMDFDEKASIPQNAELAVSEIVEESADYDSLLSQTEDALQGDQQIGYVRFFDISILADGEEVQPAAPVSVRIQLAELPPELTGNDAQVVHLGHLGEQTEVLDAQASSTGVSFEANGFSVYAVVYTVDFEYSVNGRLYDFSLLGGEKITLSELVEVLGILDGTNFADTDAFLKEVQNVEFSDPALVKVTQMEGDWELESLEPFTTEENLTITMNNGDVITVKVTDAQGDVWHVDINLYDYEIEGEELQPASTAELQSIDGKTYAILALIKEKNTGNVLGYSVSGTSFGSGVSTTSCDIPLTSIKPLTTDQNGKLVDDYSGSSFTYDSTQHDVSIRLYEGAIPADQWQYQSYQSIISNPDHANGFEFREAPNGNVPDKENQITTLNLKRAYDKQFNIRLTVDEAGLKITDADKYYALVTVQHETTGTTYAYTPVTISEGQTTVDIPITRWYDNNGNYLPNEKFTGNEVVDVKLYTTNTDGNGNKVSFGSLNDLKNSQSKVLIAEGDSVNKYNVYYGTLDPVPNDEEKKTYYYNTINFHKPSGTISKGDIDRLLDDATDFGYYTEKYLGHSGDIEATIGADYLNTEFQADFAYSSANLNVNRLKVLKIYTDENGDPAQKQVTIKLKQNGSVVAEKTGTTGSDGKLDLEFEGLGPGDYDIVEVIDGQEISTSGSASVSDKTVNTNFSIDKAHFANNTNVNYFGTIAPEMDVGKLKIMLEKASRVDVVILTDTQETVDRINAVKNSNNYGSKNIDVVVNGTEPYKQYDIKSDMVRLRQLSDDLAVAESSETIRVINVRASELGTEGLKLDDDGRYIVVNVIMDQDTFAPHILLDGKLIDSDYGQSGDSNSSKALFNLRGTDGGRYSGAVNTNKNGAGVILAPDANAHILDGPFGGTIITYQVNRQGNELHSNNPNQIQTLNAVIQNVIGEPKTGILQLSKRFSDNTKDKVTYFTFKVRLENTDVSKINGKSFPATGLKTGDTVIFNDQSEALVQVRAGNTVAIANLPPDTTYTVEEIITPETAHFQLDRYEGKEGTIEAGKTSKATVYNTTIPMNAGFVARKTVNGKMPTLQQRYDFKLDEYKNGTWANIQTQPNTGGEIKFAKVEFTEAGTYFFKIYEYAESVTDLKPDNTVYIVKVKVTGEAGNLQYETTYYEVKDPAVDAVTGDGLGTLNSSNVELVTTALFDNKDQITIKKIWANGNTGGNTEIKYTLYRTTEKPEYVDVKVTYPEAKAGTAGHPATAGTSEKTYRVMKGSELKLLLDHVWWDNSRSYSVTADNGLTFAKEGTEKNVSFNYVRYSETAWKATIPAATTADIINVTVSYGSGADLHEYMEPIMEIKPPVGEVVEGYDGVSLTGNNSQGTWRTGINGLAEKDDNGTPYYYYVYEKSLNVDEGENLQRFETTYSLVDKTAVDGEEMTITNRIRPTYAWVEVTKQWPDGSAEENSDSANATIILYRRLKGTSDRPQWYDQKIIDKDSKDPSGEKAWTAGWYVLDNDYEYFVQEQYMKDSTGTTQNLTSEYAYTFSSWGAPSYSQGENQLTSLTGLTNNNGELYYKVNTDNGGTVTVSNQKRETHLRKVWTNEVSGKINVNGTEYDLTDLAVTVKLRMYVDGTRVEEESESSYFGEYYKDWKTVFESKVMDGATDSVPTNQYGPKCYEESPWNFVWEGLPDRGVVDDKIVFYTYDAVEISVKTKDGLDLSEFFQSQSSAPGFTSIYINNTVEDSNTPKTGIKVEKKWFQDDQDITSSKSGSVTFDLYRTTEAITGSGNGGSTEPQQSNTVTLGVRTADSSCLTIETPSVVVVPGGQIKVTITSTDIQGDNYVYNGSIVKNWYAEIVGSYGFESSISDKKEYFYTLPSDLSGWEYLLFNPFSKGAAKVEAVGSGSGSVSPAIVSREDLISISGAERIKENITISAPGWTYTSGETLPKYVQGTETEWHYFVVEHEPTGYTDSYVIDGNELTIRNTESNDKGSLKVVKSIQPDNLTLTDDQKEKITFVIKDSSGQAISGGTFTLKDMSYNESTKRYEKEFSNLAIGTYSVNESVQDGSVPTGYALTMTTYEVSNGTITEEQASPLVVNADTTTVTVTNTYEDSKVGFAFSKAWLGINANVNSIQSTDLENWGNTKAISVVIKRYDPDNPADNFTLSYDIGHEGGPFLPKEDRLSGEEKATYQLTKNTNGNITTFNMGKVLEGTNSNGKPYTYYVEETTASGGTYLTYYGILSESTVTNRPDYSHAGDGDIIINLESSGYELPSTGGPGTRLFTALGELMTVTAGVILTIRRKRKPAGG